MKRSLLTSVLAAVLAPAAALSVTWIGPASVAQAAEETAVCQVHAVLASKEGDSKIPKNLEFLRETLEDDAFAAYKGFHLLERKTLELSADASANAGFKSGHKLRLRLLSVDKERLKLHAALTARDGKKSLLETDFSIKNNGQLMIQADKHKSGEVEGKLFFAIQCAKRG